MTEPSNNQQLNNIFGGIAKGSSINVANKLLGSLRTGLIVKELRGADEYQNLERGISIFETKLRLDPSNLNLRFEYAQYLYFWHNRADLSMVQLQEVLRFQPDHEGALVTSAIITELVENDFEGAERFYNKLLAYHPNSAIGHYDFGVFLENAKGQKENAKAHYTVSRRCFEKILQGITTTTTHLKFGLLLRYVYSEFDQSAIQFKKAIALDSLNFRAHGEYAWQLHEVHNDPENANHHYRQALAINPSYIKGHYDYAWLLDNVIGDLEGAAHHYKETIRLQPEHARAHYFYARLLHYKMDTADEAKKYYLKAIDINPNYAYALANYGGLLLTKYDDLPGAKLYFERCLTVDITCALAHAGLVIVYEGEGNELKVKYHFEEFLKLEPDNAESRMNYAELLVKSYNDTELALFFYNQAIQIDPQNWNIHLSYANLLRNTGIDDQAAFRHFKEAVRLKPDSYMVHNHLGLLLKFNLKDYESAKNHFEIAIKLEPRNDAAYLNLAKLYLYQWDKPVEARCLFEKILEFDSKNIYALNGLAVLYELKFKDAYTARKYYLAALAINNNVEEVHFDFAIFLENRKENDAALKEYEEALRLNWSNTMAHFYYARLQSRLNRDLAVARKHYEIAISQNPKLKDEKLATKIGLTKISFLEKLTDLFVHQNDNGLSEGEKGEGIFEGFSG